MIQQPVALFFSLFSVFHSLCLPIGLYRSHSRKGKATGSRGYMNEWMTTDREPVRNGVKRLICLPAIESGSTTKEQERAEDLRSRLNNSHRSSASVLRQHAEHATVLHGDRTWGAAGRCLPVSEAGDAAERQHVWLGAGVNFRGASHKPSQGKR